MITAAALLKDHPGCVAACGACPERASEYENSRLKKQTRLEQLFDGIAQVEWRHDPYPKTNYRRSVSLRVGRQAGMWCAGTVDREENLTPIPDCPVHRGEVNAVLKDLLGQMNRFEDAPWFAVAVHGIWLSLGFKISPHSAWPTRVAAEIDWSSLVARHGLAGVRLQCDPSMGNRRWGAKGWSTLSTGDSLAAMPLGLGLEGHLMFSQQRLELWKDTLTDAAEFLSSPLPYQFLDLYCGNGIARSFLKNTPARSLGIELSGASIAAAEAWAGKCSWSDATFLRGRARDRIPQMEQWVAEGKSQSLETTAYVNPSRLGMETEVTHALAQARPKRLAYLSCNPVSLKRDLRLLVNAGFCVQSVSGRDFFPYTRQIEALALLERL